MADMRNWRSKRRCVADDWGYDMDDIQDMINRYLYDVDAAWRFLRQGDVESAHRAAMYAERRHDELVAMTGPNGVSFKFVGNLIVGVNGGES